MPSHTAKVCSVAVLVMVVMIALSHHEEIKWQEVVGSIFNFIVSIAIFMGKPIDDGSVDWRQQKLHWK